MSHQLPERGLNYSVKKYVLREYEAKDFNNIVASYIDVFTDEPWNDQLTTPQIETYLKAITDMNTFIGYLYEHRDTKQLVGCALGFVRPWYQGQEYQMDTFFILKPYQKVGIGGLFLNEINVQLAQKEIPTIVLDTEKGTPAEKFYMAHQFRSVNNSVTFYGPTKTEAMQ